MEINGIRVIALDRLVELKLASGSSAPHRLRDLVDVRDVIGRLGLPQDPADHLNPSVREKYRLPNQRDRGAKQRCDQGDAGRPANPG